MTLNPICPLCRRIDEESAVDNYNREQLDNQPITVRPFLSETARFIYSVAKNTLGNPYRRNIAFMFAVKFCVLRYVTSQLPGSLAGSSWIEKLKKSLIRGLFVGQWKNFLMVPIFWSSERAYTFLQERTQREQPEGVPLLTRNQVRILNTIKNLPLYMLSVDTILMVVYGKLMKKFPQRAFPIAIFGALFEILRWYKAMQKVSDSDMDF